jgi:uncharacterized protein YdaU (DUF1376 family)
LNYFELHLGDYEAATAHLTALEDGIYGRLIRLYYRTEKPLPADMKQVYRLARAQAKPERDAVDQVLADFFELRADGWHQDRCDAEIERYQAGEPEREVKRANEDNRLRRHREERAKLFKIITDAGLHAAWNIQMKELRELAERCSSREPETQPATAPATPATATQTPITNHQTPDTSITTSLRSVVNPGVEQALSVGNTVVGGKATESPAAEAAPTPPATRGTRLSKDWQLPKAWGEWALAEYPQWTPAKVRLEADKFRDHWVPKTGKDAAKTEWLATWRNWCRSELAHRDDPKPSAQQRSGAVIDIEARDAKARQLLGFGPKTEEIAHG